MKIRFYLDASTRLPHIYRHDVSETKLKKCSRILARIGRVGMDPEWPSGKLRTADT
jgi:hypothetical protein